MVALPPDALVAALRDLDPGARALLDLSLRHRFDDEELANVMAVDPGTIAVRREEALERLSRSSALGGQDTEQLAQALADLPRARWAEVAQPPGTSAANGGTALGAAPADDDVAAERPAQAEAAPAVEEPAPEPADEVDAAEATADLDRGYEDEPAPDEDLDVAAAEVDAAEHPTHTRDAVEEQPPAEEELDDTGPDADDRAAAAAAAATGVGAAPVAASGTGAGRGSRATPADQGERRSGRGPLVAIGVLVLATIIAAPFLIALAGDDPDGGTTAGDQAAGGGQPAGGGADAGKADRDGGEPAKDADAGGGPEEPAKDRDANTGQEESDAGGGEGSGARLALVAGERGRGVARLADGRLALNVAGLPPGRYQVWLYNDVGDAVSLADFQGGRPVELSVEPRGRISDFQAIDISREPPEGGPGHSGDSILRVPTDALTAGG